MVALAEDVLHRVAEQARADGQAAAQPLCRGDDIGGDAVQLIGKILARPAVARLHLVRNDEEVLLLFEFEDLFDVAFGQNVYAALALHEFDHHGAGLVVHQAFQSRLVPHRSVNETLREGIEILVENVLPRCGKGGNGTTVEGVFEGDDVVRPFSLVLHAPLTRRLDGAFVGFRAAVAEENFFHPRLFNKRFRKVCRGSGIVKVGRVLHLGKLLRYRRRENAIRVAEGVDRDARAHIDIFFAVRAESHGALAAYDLQREAPVGARQIKLVLLDRVHCYSTNIVPLPSSVKSSIKMECGTLPSMIITRLTPCLMAVMQQSTLGIIPPEITPLL